MPAPAYKTGSRDSRSALPSTSWNTSGPTLRQRFGSPFALLHVSTRNQLPPAGETACPTCFAKRLIQQGGAGGFACRSNGHNQWTAKTVKRPPCHLRHRDEAVVIS